MERRGGRREMESVSKSEGGYDDKRVKQGNLQWKYHQRITLKNNVRITDL